MSNQLETISQAEAHGDTLRDALKAAIARPRTDMPADSHEGSQP